jgi:hypothetical protein
MPEQRTFDYAVIRVVPRVEREEFLNAGVILFCRTLDFLAARVSLERARLLSIAPSMSAEEADDVERYLTAIPRICAGDGPLGRLSPSERFNWLVAPRSHAVQTGPAHAGLCDDDPQRELDRLMERVVLTREPEAT